MSSLPPCLRKAEIDLVAIAAGERRRFRSFCNSSLKACIVPVRPAHEVGEIVDRAEPGSARTRPRAGRVPVKFCSQRLSPSPPFGSSGVSCLSFILHPPPRANGPTPFGVRPILLPALQATLSFEAAGLRLETICPRARHPRRTWRALPCPAPAVDIVRRAGLGSWIREDAAISTRGRISCSILKTAPRPAPHEIIRMRCTRRGPAVRH